MPAYYGTPEADALGALRRAILSNEGKEVSPAESRRLMSLFDAYVALKPDGRLDSLLRSLPDAIEEYVDDKIADALGRADADDDSNRDRDATLEDLERRLEALEED
jgi:hypothetical protein